MILARLGRVGFWALVWVSPATSAISAAWSNGSGPRGSCGLKSGSEIIPVALIWGNNSSPLATSASGLKKVPILEFVVISIVCAENDV